MAPKSAPFDLRLWATRCTPAESPAFDELVELGQELGSIFQERVDELHQVVKLAAQHRQQVLQGRWVKNSHGGCRLESA